MTTTDEKLKALARIARTFNGHGLTWAVGASAMLYLRGRVADFRDIDIMVSEECADEACRLLSELGQQQPDKPDSRFLTRHFHQFVIDGSDIDLIAGFVIINDGVPHECPLLEKDIDRKARVKGERVPLQSLAAWREFYRLMGREQKSSLCC